MTSSNPKPSVKCAKKIPNMLKSEAKIKAFYRKLLVRAQQDCKIEEELQKLSGELVTHHTNTGRGSQPPWRVGSSLKGS